MIRAVKYQNKLVGISVAFLVVAVAFFALLFPYQQQMLASRLLKLQETKKVVQELRQEQTNIQLAKQDLSEMAAKPLQPEDFFSRDTSLVAEIKNIESITSKLELDATLSVSGTSKSGLKISESKDLVGIPFALTLTGHYADLVRFMEYMENAASLTAVRSLTLGVADSQTVSASLSGSFYIKPK